jgi:hypothetical protein
VKASGRSTGGSLTVMEATIDGGPPRHIHFRSVGGPATALLIVTPGGLDEYFAELSAALAANADAAQVRTIQQAYGIARS